MKNTHLTTKYLIASSNSACGFTLVELMITVAIVAILASIALPSYTAYVQRSRVPVALDALSAMATKLEQRYQDTGNYANADGNCGVAIPAVQNFDVTCTLDDDANQTFTIKATGTGLVDGFTYTLDEQGVRKTTANPHGTPTVDCWSMRGTTCDS